MDYIRLHLVTPHKMGQECEVDLDSEYLTRDITFSIPHLELIHHKIIHMTIIHRASHTNPLQPTFDQCSSLLTYRDRTLSYSSMGVLGSVSCPLKSTSLISAMERST